MALWRLWPSTNGGTVTTDVSSSDLGVQFTVSSAVTLTGYFFWLPATGDTLAVTFRLFTTANGTSGSLVTGSQVASGTLTAGGWNFTALSPGVTLSPGTTYEATVSYTGSSNHYGATASYWVTARAGASAITSAPLTAPSATAALGGARGQFNEPSTGAFPATGTGNSANYWGDVQINDNAGACYPQVQAAPGWFPGAPAKPGDTPFTPQSHVVTAAPPAAPPAPAYAGPLITAPRSFPGAPALPGGSPFTQPGPAPSSPPPPPPFTAPSDAIPGPPPPGVMTPGNPL